MDVMYYTDPEYQAEVLFQRAIANWEKASKNEKPDGAALYILHAAREERDHVRAGGEPGVSLHGGLL